MDSRSSEKILRKLRKENNETNFLSTVSEFRFIQFLEQKELQVEYEPRIEGLNPDLRILLESSAVYADVKRFNLSDLDQKNKRFFDQLFEALKQVKHSVYVFVTQLQEFDYDSYSISALATEIEAWLFSEKRNIGDQWMDHQGFLKVQIEKINTGKNRVLSCDTPPTPVTHPRKILSVVEEKVEKYREAILDQGIPFFVCLDLVFAGTFDPQDFWDFYIGEKGTNITTGSNFFEPGAFFTHPSIAKMIGLLIRYNQEFFWIQNPLKEDVMNLGR
jgi:hypothetical protein